MVKKNMMIIYVIIVLLAILLAFVYVMGGTKSVSQQVMPSGEQCTTYAQCSQILQQQGYTQDQINSILTVCDNNGCKLLT